MPAEISLYCTSARPLRFLRDELLNDLPLTVEPPSMRRRARRGKERGRPPILIDALAYSPTDGGVTTALHDLVHMRLRASRQRTIRDEAGSLPQDVGHRPLMPFVASTR